MAMHGKAYNGYADDGMKYGEGDPGVLAAAKRNPNTEVELNGTPCGPYAHCLGYTNDGGMQGSDVAKGKRGVSYHFK